MRKRSPSIGHLNFYTGKYFAFASTRPNFFPTVQSSYSLMVRREVKGLSELLFNSIQVLEVLVLVLVVVVLVLNVCPPTLSSHIYRSNKYGEIYQLFRTERQNSNYLPVEAEIMRSQLGTCISIATPFFY